MSNDSLRDRVDAGQKAVRIGGPVESQAADWIDLPFGTWEGASRYDTDNEHVLTLWGQGRTFDLRCPKRAVGPTTPETCSTCNQPLDSPPCSLNRDTGWSGHTVSGGVVWSAGPTREDT